MDAASMKDRLIVGVDFGTTFCGVADIRLVRHIEGFGRYGGDQEVGCRNLRLFFAVQQAALTSCVLRWPGGNSLTYDKVPTEISYGPSANRSSTTSPTTPTSTSNESHQSDLTWTFDQLSSALGTPDTSTGSSTQSSTPRWGYQLRPEEERIRCIKLLLDKRQKLANDAAQRVLENLLNKAGRDVETVVADYLRELWKHARKDLTRTFDEYFLAKTKLEITLTVPAVWSDVAKHATLRAAEKAGMGSNLAMISEPEAAAVHALQAIHPDPMRTGDHLVLCDAGGGTVDLISYEVKQTSPLRLQEAVGGTGACCSGVMINLRFVEFVQNKLGAAKFNSIRKKKPRSWQTAMKAFEENVKRQFDPDVDDVSVIPFNLDNGETPHVVDGFLTVTSAEVEAMFKPIVGEVIQLVKGQVDQLRMPGKSVNGIVLVGGFGQSNYLYCQLKKWATSMMPSPMVLQPIHSWTAVVRGAVLRDSKARSSC